MFKKDFRIIDVIVLQGKNQKLELSRARRERPGMSVRNGLWVRKRKITATLLNFEVNYVHLSKQEKELCESPLPSKM